jgi:hypothetical protein
VGVKVINTKGVNWDAQELTEFYVGSGENIK